MIGRQVVYDGHTRKEGYMIKMSSGIGLNVDRNTKR